MQLSHGECWLSWSGPYLKCGSHPEGVACVYRFVGAPVEAALLPHNAPAADAVQLPPAQRLLQPPHQAQRGDGAVRPATCVQTHGSVSATSDGRPKTKFRLTLSGGLERPSWNLPFCIRLEHNIHSLNKIIKKNTLLPFSSISNDENHLHVFLCLVKSWLSNLFNQEVWQI